MIASLHFERKIYFANKPLILTNDAAAYIRAHPVAGGYLQLTGAFPRTLRLAFEHLGRPRTLGAMIEDISPEALLREVHDLYRPIDAAGGVVENEKGGILMIYRRGKWDLPKGKRDDGEDIAACALREVNEETGLQQLTLGEKICDTYHIYSHHQQELLKRTTWYKMKGDSAGQLVPQQEENILEARWIAPDMLGQTVFKSYEAIREVLRAAGCAVG